MSVVFFIVILSLYTYHYFYKRGLISKVKNKRNYDYGNIKAN
jgi:hypothetical protein